MLNNTLLKDFCTQKKGTLFLITLLGWLHSISTFMVPVSLGAFFDIHYQSITNRTKLLQLFGLHLETLGQFFTFFILIILAKMVFGLVEKQWITKLAERFIRQLIRRLFATQINWPVDTFNQKPYGNYLLRYSGDMNSVKNLLVKGIHGGIKDTLFLLSGFGILFLLNAQISILLLFSLLLYFPVMYLLDKHQKPLIKRKRDRKSLLLSFVATSFSQHADIRMRKEEETTIQTFKRKINKVLRSNIAYQRAENLRMLLAPTLGHIITGLLLWQVATFDPIQISGGALLVYLLVLSSVIAPLRRLFKVPAVIHKGTLSLNKIAVLIDKETTHDDYISKHQLTSGISAIPQ